jgi:molybdopterin molybdotransferase
MAQLSDDCFAFGGKLMTAREAMNVIAERLPVVVGTEPVALRAALGRILAHDVVSERAVPPHDNAAMDGYAVRFDDLDDTRDTRLLVSGRVAAGHPLDRAAGPGEAIRIFTGAPMPEGPDTVLMQEDCRADGDHVIVPPGIKRGANRRSAGEDIAAGDVILHAGQRLRPQELGLAASVGRVEIEVYRRLRVALFSTGDEIREVGEDLPPGCVYDSNRYTVAAMLENLGCEVDDLGILPDEYDAIERALDAAAGDHDAILTSGGVSTGDEDHVRRVVETLGSIHFWRLAIRPGRPLALGQIGHTPFIGLPGNPVAVMVTFMRLARPALLRLAGRADIDPQIFRVRAGFEYNKKIDRREWLRVRLATEPDGTVSALKFPRDGAGILSSMVDADGLVELPEDLARLEPGMMVDFLPFSEVS